MSERVYARWINIGKVTDDERGFLKPSDREAIATFAIPGVDRPFFLYRDEAALLRDALTLWLGDGMICPACVAGDHRHHNSKGCGALIDSVPCQCPAQPRRHMATRKTKRKAAPRSSGKGRTSGT